MKFQYIERKNIWPYPPPYLIYPHGVGRVKFQDIEIHKNFRFKPLRAPGARQPDAEGRISMRIAAMIDDRYCCGDAIGR
jgi:hypothetical protein